MRIYKETTVHPVQQMWQERLGKIISVANEYNKTEEKYLFFPI